MKYGMKKKELAHIVGLIDAVDEILTRTSRVLVANDDAEPLRERVLGILEHVEMLYDDLHLDADL